MTMFNRRFRALGHDQALGHRNTNFLHRRMIAMVNRTNRILNGEIFDVGTCLHLHLAP